MHTTSRVTITLLFACGLAAGAAAQEKAAPAAPVLGRDAEGRTTVRAIRLAAPLRHRRPSRRDGLHQPSPPIGDFIQTVPEENGERRPSGPRPG